MNQAAFKKFLLIALLLAAIVSIYQGYSNAQKVDGSDDYQWSPSVLFIEGVNPYAYQIQGNIEGRIILSQRPNYAHGLYVLFVPLALLDYKTATAIWAILNILMALLTIIVIGRQFKLSTTSLLICGLIFFCSTPFRNSVGNGQQSILTLFTFSLILLSHNRIGSFLSGISYFKYSFAPSLAFYILLQRGFGSFLISLLPGILGYLIFIWYLNSDPWQTLFDPLKVAMGSRPGWEGVGDWMTISKMVIPESSGIFRAILAYLTPLLLSSIIIAKAVREQKSIAFSFCIACLASLMFFSHRWYDHVFLLPVFAYAIANFRHIAAKMITVIIMWNWFAMKILRYFLENNGINFDANLTLISINFFLNIVLLICLFIVNSQIKRA